MPDDTEPLGDHIAAILRLTRDQSEAICRDIADMCKKRRQLEVDLAEFRKMLAAARCIRHDMELISTA